MDGVTGCADGGVGGDGGPFLGIELAQAGAALDAASFPASSWGSIKERECCFHCCTICGGFLRILLGSTWFEVLSWWRTLLVL